MSLLVRLNLLNSSLKIDTRSYNIYMVVVICILQLLLILLYLMESHLALHHYIILTPLKTNIFKLSNQLERYCNVMTRKKISQFMALVRMFRLLKIEPLTALRLMGIFLNRNCKGYQILLIATGIR